MRLIAEFANKEQAHTFSDYLTHSGIDNRVEEEIEEGAPLHEIWVVAEDDVVQSEELLEKFLKNPGSAEYRDISKSAHKIRKKAQKEAQKTPAYMDARTTVFYRGHAPNGFLTYLLILVCAAVALFTRLGDNTDTLGALFITDVIRDGGRIAWMPGLPEIMNGEIWRIFTPMFIHFGILHLVFNMMWLRDLGCMIEDRKGSLFLIVFVLLVGGAANLVQYLVSHPLFGGMSGVVYGLLGYTWMKGKYEPGSHLGLHKQTVVMMLVWYVLCFTGLLGPIANAAHTVGLVMGVAWGYLTSGHLWRLLKKWKK